MILGDNIYHGNGFTPIFKEAVVNAQDNKTTIFRYYVYDSERFGIVEFDEDEKVISVEVKPQNPKSNYCTTGLNFYDNQVVDFTKKVKPSSRGELVITDLNRMHLEDGTLNVKLLGKSYEWLDTGTIDSLVETVEFVQMIEKRQRIKISTLGIIAYHIDWIDKQTL